jgi:hypothetical protein
MTTGSDEATPTAQHGTLQEEPKPMTTTEDIIRIAALILNTDDGDAASLDEIGRELDKLDMPDKMDVLVASKLLAGKPYQIVSDNPDTIARARLLAEQIIGASVRCVASNDERTHIVFDPPARQ